MRMMLCQKPEGKRILEKYTLAWEDDIKKGLKFYVLKDYIIVEEGESTARFAKTAMNLRISYIKGTKCD